MNQDWTICSPTRNAQERRKLLVELDVLAAMNIKITLDELIGLYKSQFPVLSNYERSDHYDANGRKVPNHIVREYRKYGDTLPSIERSWTHPQSEVEYIFEFPFRTLDREQDYREAWARFEKEFGERDGSQAPAGPR